MNQCHYKPVAYTRCRIQRVKSPINIWKMSRCPSCDSLGTINKFVFNPEMSTQTSIPNLVVNNGGKSKEVTKEKKSEAKGSIAKEKKTAVAPPVVVVAAKQTQASNNEFAEPSPQQACNRKMTTTEIALNTLGPNNALANLSQHYDKYKELRYRVEESFKARRIFLIHGYYPSLRRALIKRGWVEKLAHYQLVDKQKLSQTTLLREAKSGNDYEVAAVSKMLQGYPPYFIWQSKRQYDTFDHVAPYRNRIKRCPFYDFTIKEGLINCMLNSHWYTIDGIAELSHPRSYRLSVNEDVKTFIEDYRFTCCTNLINFINTYPDQIKLFGRDGVVSCECIDFAIKQIRDHISHKNHEDIDIDMGRNDEMMGPYWLSFLYGYNCVVRDKMKFKLDDNKIINKLLTICKSVITQAIKLWPDINNDGFLNLWILKPGNRCRGIDIKIVRDESEVLNYSGIRNNQRYIVQKYIERPLLIYNTKFDLRQYFLVTHKENIKVWMYKTCYFRFSSQEFSLVNWHESVHLTNHAIQKKYSNQKERSELLPVCNMWNLEQFKDYLRMVNKENEWTDHIYPAMKRNVLAAILATQEDCDLQKNCYELYGCDFMLTENLDPLLIEINCSPDLSGSTQITRKICSEVLEDLIKVVIDYSSDTSAPTGNFEKIFEIDVHKVPVYCSGLILSGFHIGPESHTMRHAIEEFGKNKRIPCECYPSDIVNCRGDLYMEPLPVQTCPNPRDYLKKTIEENQKSWQKRLNLIQLPLPGTLPQPGQIPAMASLQLPVNKHPPIPTVQSCKVMKKPAVVKEAVVKNTAVKQLNKKTSTPQINPKPKPDDPTKIREIHTRILSSLIGRSYDPPSKCKTAVESELDTLRQLKDRKIVVKETNTTNENIEPILKTTSRHVQRTSSSTVKQTQSKISIKKTALTLDAASKIMSNFMKIHSHQSSPYGKPSKNTKKIMKRKRKLAANKERKQHKNANATRLNVNKMMEEVTNNPRYPPNTPVLTKQLMTEDPTQIVSSMLKSNAIGKGKKPGKGKKGTVIPTKFQTKGARLQKKVFHKPPMHSPSPSIAKIIEAMRNNVIKKKNEYYSRYIV